MHGRSRGEWGGVRLAPLGRTARFPLVKALVLCGFFGLFVVVSCTVGRWPLPSAPRLVSLAAAGGPAPQGAPMDDAVLRHAVHRMEAISFKKPAPFLRPWGGERLAALKEWTHIYYSIRVDVPLRAPANDTGVEDTKSLKSPFAPLQILVYDADDGYLTLSLARFVPESSVTSVALGGCPQVNRRRGECNPPHQVLAAMETRWNFMQAANAGVEKPHLFLCASPTMSLVRLENVAGRHILADYQVVVSLFDRFPPAPTKRAFQRALISLLKSAKVATFITLPVYGRGGHRAGNALHWYNQPHDPEKLLTEAAELFYTPLSFVRLGIVRQGNENRALFRVEVLQNRKLTEQETVSCELRRRILRCDPPGPLVTSTT
ncbi:uncharacterized protein Tco025E_04239 [Trypanosoma conorhini]|uniref:Uncharacterized protein n=1 Tax=Trypanosoma conorhini TaxID=83891 RepID=A0A422PMX2_9TRYP|nr:uncharacterized protein Tco025E_04239 [Trypanosoma conorhini]RNF19075.1 hypothetical protein Tco025E_04239 [Trypanosoma conorhini]